MKLGLSDHPGLLLVGATLGGVMLPILLAESCERLKFPWLFRKPDWLTIKPESKLQPSSHLPVRSRQA
jgi:hypothetical protein